MESRPQYRKPVFVGHIVLPSDVQREEYVAFAMRTHTACVLTSDGEFIRNCPVAYSFCGYNDGFFNALDFPEKSPSKNSQDSTSSFLGSQVVLVTPMGNDLPIIIGCLPYRNGHSQIDFETQLKIYRASKNGSYIIEGNALQGIVNIMADNTATGTSALNLTSKSPQRLGTINLYTDSFTVDASISAKIRVGDVIELLIRNLAKQEAFASMKYERGTGLTFVDEFGNTITTVDGQMMLDADEILIGVNATEPMVLGDTLANILKDLLQGLVDAKVTTALGPQPLINFATFLSLKASVDTILSKKSKIE